MRLTGRNARRIREGVRAALAADAACPVPRWETEPRDYRDLLARAREQIHAAQQRLSEYRIKMPGPFPDLLTLRAYVETWKRLGGAYGGREPIDWER